MLKIGITGGIGSGKTTVCKLFEIMGIPVYYADERAKWLISNDVLLKEKLSTAFGHEAYHHDGAYNRAYISKVVFNDSEKLSLLNSLVHPAVFEDSEKWLVKHKEFPYIIKEAALLFESGSYKQMDRILLVEAPLEKRIDRVIKRDKVTRASVIARMNAQWAEEKKRALAHDLIINDGTQSIVYQAYKIHHFYLKLSKEYK